MVDDALASRIEDQLHGIERRLGERLDALENRLERRLETCQNLENRIKNRMEGRFRAIERRMDARFDRMDVRLEVLERLVVRPDEEQEKYELDEREDWRCLPSDVLPKVCDFVGPQELGWLAATSRTWRRWAWSSNFWTILDKERFGLYLDRDSFWKNRRDRAWKLRVEDSRGPHYGIKPDLRDWPNPAMRIQTLAETGRLSLVRDADFSFFRDARLTEVEVRRVIKTAQRLTSVRVASEGASLDVFPWLKEQLDALVTEHRHPEILENFCFHLEYDDDLGATKKDCDLIFETWMTKVMTKFPNVRRASVPSAPEIKFFDPSLLDFIFFFLTWSVSTFSKL